MSTETLTVDGELSDVGLVTNSELDHDEDPDISSATVNATGNNVNTEWGGDFPTPTGNPTVGADLQEFRVGVIEFDSGQSGTPSARIELWENGVLVRAGANTNVSAYAVLSFRWNASELATADGSLVQCKLIGTKSGGGPSKRNSTRIGHMEWNADYTVVSSQTILIGQAVEADIAQAFTPSINVSVVIGQATESDTAKVFTPVTPISATISQAVETDTSQALTPVTNVSGVIGQAIETDTAQSLTPAAGVTGTIGQAVETDSAQALMPQVVVIGVIGQAQETDTAQTLTPLIVVLGTIGQAVETDSAQNFTPITPVLVVIGQAIETGAAQTLAPSVTGGSKMIGMSHSVGGFVFSRIFSRVN